MTNIISLAVTCLLAGQQTSFRRHAHYSGLFTELGNPCQDAHTKFRRPVILNDADIEVWLDSPLTEVIIENLIDDGMPDELLTAYSVSKDLYRSNPDTQAVSWIPEKPDHFPYPNIPISKIPYIY